MRITTSLRASIIAKQSYSNCKIASLFFIPRENHYTLSLIVGAIYELPLLLQE